MHGRSILEESTTYQATIRRGEIRQAQRAVLILGEDRFGPPSAAISQTMQTIGELARLERMLINIMKVATWDELMGRSVLEDSATYQATLLRGMIQGAIRMLGAVAEERLGPPNAGAETALHAVTDFDRLVRMARRAFTVISWAELLATP